MRYKFADCILDTDTRALTRGSGAVPTEPQVFDLLALLAENAGSVVDRDRIIDVVWQGRIVSDSAISARIAAARKAVGDDGKSQRVIRTVPRRGLIMVAEVTGPPAPEERPAEGPLNDIQRIRYARTTDGHLLAYAVTGSGPKVMRMDSQIVDLEVEWRLPADRKFYDRLNERFRLLRFDHLGSGQSDRSVSEYDPARMAENAVAVADAAGFDRFAMFSHSGGVLPAVHFAARFPDRVERLVIVGGYAEGPTRRGTPESGQAMKNLIREGWGKPDSPFATGFLATYFPEGPLETVHDYVTLLQAAQDADSMLRLRDAMNDASIIDLLPQIRCPTLIIHSRHDAVHPLSEARKLAADIPDAELVILETANHFPLPGNPVWEGYVETLLDFLSG